MVPLKCLLLCPSPGNQGGAAALSLGSWKGWMKRDFCPSLRALGPNSSAPGRAQEGHPKFVWWAILAAGPQQLYTTALQSCGCTGPGTCICGPHPSYPHPLHSCSMPSGCALVTKQPPLRLSPGLGHPCCAHPTVKVYPLYSHPCGLWLSFHADRTANQMG